MASGIYTITNTANGKLYIGSAVDIPARWRNHRYLLRKGTHTSRHLQRAYLKYGCESFSFAVILLCDEWNLILYEQRAIDTYNPAYNSVMTAGRNTGMRHSEESKAKMSAALKGRVSPKKGRILGPLSDEHKAKLRAAWAQKKASGFVWKSETLSRRSEALKGRPLSSETKAKISSAKLGKKLTEAHKAAIGFAHTGLTYNSKNKRTDIVELRAAPNGVAEK